MKGRMDASVPGGLPRAGSRLMDANGMMQASERGFQANVSGEEMFGRGKRVTGVARGGRDNGRAMGRWEIAGWGIRAMTWIPTQDLGWTGFMEQFHGTARLHSHPSGKTSRGSESKAGTGNCDN